MPEASEETEMPEASGEAEVQEASGEAEVPEASEETEMPEVSEVMETTARMEVIRAILEILIIPAMDLVIQIGKKAEKAIVALISGGKGQTIRMVLMTVLADSSKKSCLCG